MPSDRVEIQEVSDNEMIRNEFLGKLEIINHKAIEGERRVKNLGLLQGKYFGKQKKFTTEEKSSSELEARSMYVEYNDLKRDSAQLYKKIKNNINQDNDETINLKIKEMEDLLKEADKSFEMFELKERNKEENKIIEPPADTELDEFVFNSRNKNKLYVKGFENKINSMAEDLKRWNKKQEYQKTINKNASKLKKIYKHLDRGIKRCERIQNNADLYNTMADGLLAMDPSRDYVTDDAVRLIEKIRSKIQKYKDSVSVNIIDYEVKKEILSQFSFKELEVKQNPYNTLYEELSKNREIEKYKLKYICVNIENIKEHYLYLYDKLPQKEKEKFRKDLAINDNINEKTVAWSGLNKFECDEFDDPKYYGEQIKAELDALKETDLQRMEIKKTSRERIDSLKYYNDNKESSYLERYRDKIKVKPSGVEHKNVHVYKYK